ncbi:phosphate acyltransferase PlsX [Penaeicola halotolerans]|uniref:phosphate acyltransferase PlsX n=1 Tax=Penaeicola halotolerans TaxID=2793196 RepID=UPI001CF7F5BF|nr:phosphate acyltransferase PlsX [Penaeicola halotolerans]
MKIAVDAMGGDFAPENVISGVKLALEKLPKDITIVLVGPEELIKAQLKDHNISSPQLEIMHAEEVIEMGENPTKAFSQKPQSSISVGYKLLKSKSVEAFCSAGNTGAMLVGAMFTIKPIEGVFRPAIASFMPKETLGFGVILDVGANADVKPDVLNQFAILGSIYAEHVLKINNPKVGLMNIGEEEKKGNLVCQATFPILQDNPQINFIGNIEGRDAFNDKADVIVCDGFTGNILIKMGESLYDLLKSRNFLDPFFENFNYEAVGGSPILGVNGNVIVGHGISSPEAIKNMILQAEQMAKADIYHKIYEAFNGNA